jgi:hypothetical protein
LFDAAHASLSDATHASLSDATHASLSDATHASPAKGFPRGNEWGAVTGTASVPALRRVVRHGTVHHDEPAIQAGAKPLKYQKRSSVLSQGVRFTET